MHLYILILDFIILKFQNKNLKFYTLTKPSIKHKMYMFDQFKNIIYLNL